MSDRLTSRKFVERAAGVRYLQNDVALTIEDDILEQLSHVALHFPGDRILLESFDEAAQLVQHPTHIFVDPVIAKLLPSLDELLALFGGVLVIEFVWLTQQAAVFFVIE